MAPDPAIGPMGDVTCVRGEAFAVSDAAGDIIPGGSHGVYLRDTRFLDHLEVLVDGARPLPLAAAMTGAASATFHGHVVVPHGGPDPTVLVERRRMITGSLHEHVTISNRGRTPQHVELQVRLGTDFAYIFDVRHSRVLPSVPPKPTDRGVRFVRDDGVDVLDVTTTPSPVSSDGATLRFPLDLAPGTHESVCIDMAATDVYGTEPPRGPCPVAAGRSQPAEQSGDPSWQFHCTDRQFEQLIRHSLRDLHALRLQDPLDEADAFCAAGSPWYLTLFGRDSLWAAFMAAPFDLELAAGTLRTLARRQGTRVDPDTEEAPGKILHEIRRGSLTHRGDLPPNYYGSVDATPLFVVLAHEAWRWGLPDSQVRALLPNVEAALGWMRDHGDPDGDGLLEYVRSGERGLVNQGWKDSHDGIQFTDGQLALAPIALAEVQGYAHAAAVRGADLLEHFGRPGADAWRSYAADLAARFRQHYWLEDDTGPYPAIALDRVNRPVTGPASNMGHLLHTGILAGDEATAVAQHLSRSTMDSGWGLRTLATTAAGFNPLSYHGGSVWPHDTAIAVWGLASTGHIGPATSLLRGLIDASAAFGYRLPELYGGFARTEAPRPVPYPAACSPQAWSAAGALLLLRAVLGLHADVPSGRITVNPMWPPPFRSIEVTDLPIVGGTISVRVDADGGVGVQVSATGLELDIIHGHD
jgi:glycogen debranching enzyme